MKTNRAVYSMVMALLVVLLAIPVTAQDSDATLAAIRATYPRVDGSTSALPLQRVIASAVHDIPWYWTTDGYQDHYYVMAVLASQDLTRPDLRRRVELVNDIYHSGTHGSYMSLIDDMADFILVAREPSADELAAAEEAGITLDVQPVALDAFVFLLNTTNPTDSLTLDEIRSIYTGTTTTWTELGVSELIEEIPSNYAGDFAAGAEENSIYPYTRNANSGSQELMDLLVMQGTPVISDQNMMQSNMGAPIIMVGYNSRGIGYSVFFYTSFIHIVPSVKLIGVEGVVPTSATIADGSYPLVTEVYAVVRADMPADAPAVLLRDWLLTVDGQAAIASSGYVPLPEE